MMPDSLAPMGGPSGDQWTIWLALVGVVTGATAYVHRVFATKESMHARLDRIEDKLDRLIEKGTGD